MKKFICLFFCFPIVFFGQEKSFETGVFIGGSLNSLNGIKSESSPAPNTKLVLPTAGFLAQYNFNNKISLKTKLLYQPKGQETVELLSDGSIGLTNNKDLLLHYITTPILTQINFGNNKWKYFVNTGLYVGFLISSEVIYNDEKTKKSIEDLKKTDFGLALGSGVSFKINERSRVFLESSWDYGLSNISKINLVNVNSIMTEAITLNIGIAYNFPFKNKTFNGLSKLDCPDYENTMVPKEKRSSKWRLVLYKDGERVIGKKKKGKSRLFKKKN